MINQSNRRWRRQGCVAVPRRATNRHSRAWDTAVGVMEGPHIGHLLGFQAATSTSVEHAGDESFASVYHCSS